MIRISATNLESYRRWLANEESSIDELVSYLRRETPATEAMLAGSAFHKVLENAQYGQVFNVIEQDGFKFDFTCFDGELILPETRELKIEKQTEINGEPVTFVGVVDAISVNEIFDHKFTSNLDAESYAASMQWRCYLDWFNADKFTYNLFQNYKPANKDFYQVKSLLPISFFRYPNMRKDIEEMAAEFIGFVKQYVPEMVK